MCDEDVVPGVLPAREGQEVLERLILPTWASGAVTQDHPVVVFIAGQPGAGKTQLGDLVEASLRPRGGAVRVGRDLYKAEHRRYAEFLAEDVRTAGARVRPDTRRWQAGVEEYVRACGFDAVVETALADVDEFREVATVYRQARYRIEVAALATPEALSQLGILERFLTEAVAGGGRFVAWENHDGCAQGMVRTLDAVEAEHLADRVLVVRRDAEVLYDNELVDGTWRRPAGAAGTVVAERARPWTAQETGRFRRELADVDRRLHRDLVDVDRRLAVQRDTERAAALAEPVRRTAQARVDPPGVDYHRLSAAEHKWVWEELILPSYLADITAQDRPVVVYVMGQPGAGKTTATRLVRRAVPGATRISGEDFKVSHPDYLQLLREEPRTASARIRVDYQAWQAQAEAYVRERRGNALIEIAPGSVEQFLASALSFRQAGVRVEVAVIAARAADSRQATAARYAEVVRLGIPARFTSASGHDRCFAALADTVQAAEEQQVADSVVVMRRDGTALYRGDPAADGSQGGPAGAAWALVAEQQRPYTLAEATRFLAVQRELRSALPQHRDELRRIEALARPLLPARLQPWQLGTPATAAFLPLPAPAQGYGSLNSFNSAA